MLDAESLVIGWCEPVSLHALGIERAFAKIDSGAELSSLHALQPIVVEEGRSVEFTPPLLRRQSQEHLWQPVGVRRVRAPLIDERMIRNSAGDQQTRFVIRTELTLGPVSFPIDLTLTQRFAMRFPLLLGREALCAAPRPILVDPRTPCRLDRPT